MPNFFPGHLRSVADSYDAAAAKRDEQARQFEQHGDVTSAEQCREWAAACRATADTIRNPKE